MRWRRARGPIAQPATSKRRRQLACIPLVVRASSSKVIGEDDGDKHLVLQDAAGNTMIGEAPTLSCTGDATVFRRNQMAQARTAVTVCTKAEITGVAFFDFSHHQTGVAPNEIELRPILAFRCLTP